MSGSLPGHYTQTVECPHPCFPPEGGGGVPFSLDSDASDSGLGALLSQFQSGKERVIAYAARALSKAERNSTSRHSSMVDIFWPGLTIVLCNGVWKTQENVRRRFYW